ncbi:hypothetical protein Vi05172_g13361 [Venturia inaequalis]|nr:hypothetical protein Vi05172_g13361 [Venturia inaequalis]
MFRCSLARVCRRRRTSPLPSPAWTIGTSPSWTIRTSPSWAILSSSQSFSTSSNTRNGNADTVVTTGRARLCDARLQDQFIAPSAGGITATTGQQDDPHALLVRAGYVRQAHAGVFHLLPLALKVQRRVEAGLQMTMHNLGASEVSLSSISSEALWKRSGRINQPLKVGQHEFMTIQDRRESGFILSPTHEEEITSLVSEMTNSYKDFPLRLFQISRKYRDELRPRQGLLRTKEFMMKDLYTFDTTEKAALATYQSVRAGYRDFFEALGVPYVEVEASSGNMGGSLSHEYHFLSPLGEDTIIICESCGFAANEEILPEKAESQDKHQCPRCTGSKISTHRAIEIGHTFHLGTRYTEPLGVSTILPTTAQSSVKSSIEPKPQASDPTAQTNSTGRVPLQMGCHGIGVSRVIGAVAAMTADKKGLCWPPVMAPYQVAVVFDGSTPPSNPDFPDITNDYKYFCDRIGAINYKGPWGSSAVPNISMVFDDRDKPLPWKLKDADLTGYPVIIVVGKSFKQSGKYEIQCRSSPQLSVTSDSLAASVLDILNKVTPTAAGDSKHWRLGPASLAHLTQEQFAGWNSKSDEKKDSNSLLRSAGKENSATLMKPTPPLAKKASAKDEPPAMAESGYAFTVLKPQCVVCGKRHRGKCNQTKSRKASLQNDVTTSDARSAYRSSPFSGAKMAEARSTSRERSPNLEELLKQLSVRPAAQISAAQDSNTTSAKNERPERVLPPVGSESPDTRENSVKLGVNWEKTLRKPAAYEKRQFEELSDDVPPPAPIQEEVPPPAPIQQEVPPPAPIQREPTPSHAPILSHEHLLERVTLLERLMALKAEEEMLKKQGGR